MEQILLLLSDPAIAAATYSTIGAVGLIGLYGFLRKKSGIESKDKDRPEELPRQSKTSDAEWPVAVDKPEELDQSVVEAPVKKNLKEALSGTKANIFGRMKERLSGGSLNDSDIESLEEILYTSDLGPQTVQRLIEAVGDSLKSSEKKSVEKVQSAIKEEMNRIFGDIHSDVDNLSVVDSLGLKLSDDSGLQVIMVVGVNGAGKTTTIGKVAHQLTASGKKVLLLAGDTFRAAAEEQLEVWSERAGVDVFSPEGVKEPSAVAYQGLEKAKLENYDVVIVDTAGRLHTQDNLMEELKKMKRVIKKVVPEAPHQTLIVLDANSGQNALLQAKYFNEALDLTGAILTKLDGSAKGGVAVGLAYELSLPIRLIGIGEGIEDLRPFEPREFVDSII